MLNYDEIRYVEIDNCITNVKEGKLSSHWQGYATREFDSLRDTNVFLPSKAQVLHDQLQTILAVIPQDRDDEQEHILI